MEKKQNAYVYQSDSIRDLISFINERGIQHKDVLSNFQDARTNEFVLIYYI